MPSINTVQGATVLANSAGDTFAEVEAEGLPVLIKYQSEPLLSLYFTKEVQVLTLVAPTAVDDETVTVSAGGAPIVGNMAFFKEGNIFYQGEILTSVVNGPDWDITLGTPLDGVFTVAANATEGDPELAVNGNVTPVEYQVLTTGLAAGANWHAEKMVAEITDATAMDDSTFGAIAGLAKGLLGRVKNPITKNLFNVQSNGAWALETFVISYSDKAPAGFYGFIARKAYEHADLILNASTNDKISMIVRDDLTGLTSFKMKVIGHNHS
jgi:hypothetical protein